MTERTYDIRIERPNTPESLELARYAFATTPEPVTDERKERYRESHGTDKGIFSYIDNHPVAKVDVIPMTQNVRGTVMPMGGISGVCSMPIARRGGHVRALMQRAIEEMHEDGQAISTLFPFKTSYYEMFGYAGWQIPMWVRIRPAALAPYLKMPKIGTVQHRLASDAQDDAYALITAAQRILHGMSRQPREKFDAALKWQPMWLMSVHEGDQVTGGLSYKLDPDKKVMEVHSAFWLTENAKVQALDYMARHVDQVGRIAMPLLPGEQPHLWLTDDDALTISSVEDHGWNAPMARIVTITGLNGITAGNGSVALAIQDPQAPWNTGTWTFTGSGGVLEVTQGGEPAGDLTINGLSALVMSGIDPVTLPYRGWGQVEPDAINAVRSLFPSIVPYLHDQF